MLISLKTKIWLLIVFIILIFSFFTLYYFPRQQGTLLINNYNIEVQNLANTVSLGVKIALTEQNFEGVQTAIEFVKDDPRLQFVSMIQYDTSWNLSRKDYQLSSTVINTYPETENPSADIVSTDTIIVKRSPFETPMMSGEILLGFNTKEIVKSKLEIRNASLFVSTIFFLIGIFIGFWLAKNISVPVLALRDAAHKVGEGDLNQKVKHLRQDEIGELGKAFNKMVDDLAMNRAELNEKNNVLSETVGTLNNTLAELKNTHAQLIQSEKMASLGELTAGIAHEIQNPLNFVNNFSEINAELIEEMKAELSGGNTDEVLTIAKMIAENEKKINHHGKRADVIVKGMLQHSRVSTGIKEPSRINVLADEYIKLAFHGLRAKDKSFNATLKTEYDKSIGKINIVPQDIGRVMVNLITNAFYAVAEKSRQGVVGYEPTVTVHTKKSGDTIIISVADNGNGVPQKILDKIFQPFFTTKPTGQGTGLGLSLAYDIVKAHGGELKVETNEGDGSTFTFQIPVA